MILIHITNDRQDIRLTHGAGPLEFGRSVEAKQEGVKRVAIDDRYVSRHQLRIVEIQGGKLRLENLGQSLWLPDGSPLEENGAREWAMPVRIALGYTTLDIALVGSSAPDQTDSPMQTISRPSRGSSCIEPKVSLAELGGAPTSEKLGQWLETLLAVQRSAAGSSAFYEETADALVKLVGLDRGMVLLRGREGDWNVVAAVSRQGKPAARFSRAVLDRTMAENRTFILAPRPEENYQASLKEIEAVVASPIFDALDQPLGVVYGSRDRATSSAGPVISQLEAQLVQLLAAAVSAGLARMDQEREAARMRVQFEQFLSPELARELEANPKLLEGTQREISILFCDMRGFSRISERLGARDTYRLVGDVMDRLTDCVLRHAGVIIDYYGDGMAAMWNAPTADSAHAERASAAGLALLNELPGLNQAWESLAGQPLRLGVGVNTGVALVGNSGSARRMKYGPRGHAVNLASRLEGATKYLGVPLIVSGATAARLPAEFAARRLCSIRVVGIQEAVAVHELRGAASDSAWLELKKVYEEALSNFEQGRAADAARLLERLSETEAGRNDLPCRLLQQRVEQALTQGNAGDYETVWSLEGK